MLLCYRQLFLDLLCCAVPGRLQSRVLLYSILHRPLERLHARLCKVWVFPREEEDRLAHVMQKLISANSDTASALV
jgi:hypothetical protein